MKVSISYTPALFVSALLLVTSSLANVEGLKIISHFTGWFAVSFGLPLTLVAVWFALKFKGINKSSFKEYLAGMLKPVCVLSVAVLFKYTGWDYLALAVFATGLTGLFINHCTKR